MTVAKREVRALSVRQPWASLIAKLRKSIEIRSWATTYRGELAIHASMGHAPRNVISRVRDEYPDSIVWPRGAIVAVVRLHDVRPLRASDRDAACITAAELSDVRDLFAWCLGGVIAVDPVPCIGRLSLFKLPTKVAAQVAEQTQLSCRRTCAMPTIRQFLAAKGER